MADQESIAGLSNEPDLEYRMLLSLEEIDNGFAVAPGDDAEMSASERQRVLLALDARACRACSRARCGRHLGTCARQSLTESLFGDRVGGAAHRGCDADSISCKRGLDFFAGFVDPPFHSRERDLEGVADLVVREAHQVTE